MWRLPFRRRVAANLVVCTCGDADEAHTLVNMTMHDQEWDTVAERACRAAGFTYHREPLNTSGVMSAAVIGMDAEGNRHIVNLPSGTRCTVVTGTNPDEWREGYADGNGNCVAIE